MNIEAQFVHATDESYILQDFRISHASGFLEDIDAEVQAHPAQFNSTFRFDLQGEVFHLSACELRQLLRARDNGAKP